MLSIVDFLSFLLSEGSLGLRKVGLWMDYWKWARCTKCGLWEVNCIAEFIALFCISRKIKYCLKFENLVTLPHGGQLQFRFHHSASLQESQQCALFGLVRIDTIVTLKVFLESTSLFHGHRFHYSGQWVLILHAYVLQLHFEPVSPSLPAHCWSFWAASWFCNLWPFVVCSIQVFPFCRMCIEVMLKSDIFHLIKFLYRYCFQEMLGTGGVWFHYEIWVLDKQNTGTIGMDFASLDW